MLYNNKNCITGYDDYLYNRIKKSMEKAESVDMIVSFLKESGVKLIKDELEYIKNKGIKIRILTGNYLNITEPSALYLLKDILGDSADIRFYRDKSRSFHPKAYIFEYENGEGEIYIGSSNLSKSALTSGIEWNYRIDKKEKEDDYSFFKDKFEYLFNNQSVIVNDFELKKYAKQWKRPRIYSDLEDESDRQTDTSDLDNKKVIDIFEPRGAQIEALYELYKTREEGNDKALVVAATGIGKTYLAAFDSKRYNRILFVAHREEILKQAYESFKNIRKDKIINHKNYMEDILVADEKADYIYNGYDEEYNMGFFAGDKKENDKDIIFASVQSLGKAEYLNDKIFEKDYFDYIIVDEFHHAVSKNYKNIIEYFTPKFMLGLTATPDRLDNKDVFSLCDYNTVYEVDLKGAIDRGWLVPFRYYGIYDESVNYDNIEIKNGKYNESELESALNINKRAELIINHYRKYDSKRALGFCISKKHAEFMAEYFNKNNIKAVAVYSGKDGRFNCDRDEAIKKLKNGEIQVIFSVDMFNEGLDIKSVDMVMFLRPTESPTVFLQQLGRGLRTYKEKKYLNVLDFIGNYKRANLIPFLISGNKRINFNGRETKVNSIKEDDYPQDCRIDFDMRLVDLFKRMENENKKISEKIEEEYVRVRENLGHRPSRKELFTYMDDDIYLSMKKKPKENIFRDYIGFLYRIEELEEDEKWIYKTRAHDFINMIEKTSMSKSYKMPILMSFYNDGNIKRTIDNEDIYTNMRDFYSEGSNKVDMYKNKSTKGFESWDRERFLKLARDNPVKYLLKTESDCFHSENGNMCINDDIYSYSDKKFFAENMIDAIEYRVKEYYKIRFENKNSSYDE